MSTTPAAAPVFAASDDRWHFAQLGDDWWATETAWFSFHHKERRLGGWFYTMARPNIGTLAGGAWVWDASAHLPWEVPYCANYTALQLPRDQDLDDCRLPNGVGIRVLEPGQRYALEYADAPRFSAQLEFAGVMPPSPLTAAGSTFGAARHFDQLGHVTGVIELHGERLVIDCFAMRDRTWGRRPEHRPRQAAYVTGAAGADCAFLAVLNSRGGESGAAHGFLRRDGITLPLAAGSREVERDGRNGWVTSVRMRLRDAGGRQMLATGVPVSRIIINRHTFIDINSLLCWQIDDIEGWGEDQDMWPVHAFARRTAGTRG